MQCASLYTYKQAYKYKYYADRSRQTNEFSCISNINMGEKVENEQCSCMQQHGIQVLLFLFYHFVHTKMLVQKQYR